MKKLIFFICCSLSLQGFAQTFSNNVSGPIAGNTNSCFDINVTGVGVIDAVNGLTEVCLDMTYGGPANAIVTLVAPDGTIIYLSYENGDFGSDFGQVCFDMNALSSIGTSTNPYAGSYIPDMNFGTVNNGTLNADGTWQICIENGWSWSETFNSGSITFGPNPPVSCGALAGDDCTSAPTICDFSGYCGTTLPIYSATAVTSGCGYSINNNSFVSFIASATTVSIDVEITNCTNGDGVQFEVFSGVTCGSLVNVDCGPSNPMAPGNYSFNFNSMTPGQEYYLMIDGYAGDVCSYNFNAGNGVAVVEINEGASLNACTGDDISLSVPNIPGNTYSWTWNGGSSGPLFGDSVTIPGLASSTTVIVTASGNCDNTTDEIIINVASCCDANAGSWN
jgi:hypothetical protein